jgi:cell division protein FtsI/penicillin-binding protein 2
MKRLKKLNSTEIYNINGNELTVLKNNDYVLTITIIHKNEMDYKEYGIEDYYDECPDSNKNYRILIANNNEFIMVDDIDEIYKKLNEVHITVNNEIQDWIKLYTN